MKIRLFASSMLTCVGISFATTAGAQSTGFAVNRFEPSESGSEWFVLDSLDMRGNVRPAIGVVGDWAYRPLAVYNSDGSVRAAIVSQQAVVHAGGSLVLWNRLRLGLSLPIQVYANGDAVTFKGVAYAPPKNATAIGDLRAAADVRLIGQYGEVFTAAMGARLWLPTGDSDSYAGDASVRVGPHVLVAGDIGAFAYAGEVSVLYRGNGANFGGGNLGSEVSFAGSGGLRLADRKLIVGPEVFGTTSIASSDAFFAKRTTPLEGAFGAHYTFGDFRIGAGFGTGLSRGFGAPVVRGLLSAEWVPTMAPKIIDRDGDGIRDAYDACPDVPGVRTTNPKTNGCPAADRDHDGVLDSEDACTDIPGVRTKDPNTNGCPADRDEDGIPDSLDACPDVVGQRSDDPKMNGCPGDRDKDGILDTNDACPDVAGIKTNDPATNGCPPDLDRDKDGIPNDTDACPDVPGNPSPDPKRNGCPIAFVQGGTIRILDQVKFKTASAQILPGKDSEEVLQAVLKVLNDHPELKSVRVEGHTDNRGAPALNRKLSADRAATVAKWLVSHGIDASRLTSAGFGPDRPLSDNQTEEGRALNRRVEFNISETAPTTPQAAPPAAPPAQPAPTTPPTMELP